LFIGLANALKRSHFSIMEGVDSEEVSTFVNWVDPGEQKEKW
jgi:hypothetical protein